MMAVVGVLKTTGVFPWAVGRLLRRAGGRPRIIQSLIAWFTGTVSAFADNVTTVIFVTPMSVEMARLTGVRPAAYLLPMVMAANIGGTATLIGDPPNIMIGSGANLSFMDFIRDLTVPVLWMMVMLEFFSRWYYRSALVSTRSSDVAFAEPDIHDRALLTWTLGITALIFLGFVTHSVTGMPVSVPAVIGAAAILIAQDVLYLRRRRPTRHERVYGLLEVIEKEIEWPTLIVLRLPLHRGRRRGGDRPHRHHGERARLGDQPGSRQSRPLRTGHRALRRADDPLGQRLPVGADRQHPLCGGHHSDRGPAHRHAARAIPTRSGGRWRSAPASAATAPLIGASANVTTIGLAEKGGTRISFLEFSRFGVSVATLTLVISSIFLAGYVYLGRPGSYSRSVWAGLQ